MTVQERRELIIKMMKEIFPERKRWLVMSVNDDGISEYDSSDSQSAYGLAKTLTNSFENNTVFDTLPEENKKRVSLIKEKMGYKLPP